MRTGVLVVATAAVVALSGCSLLDPIDPGTEHLARAAAGEY